MMQVDCKHIDRYPTRRRHANKNSTLPAEMLCPLVSPRVEQSNELSAISVYARDVRALVVVAGKAGKRKVVGGVGAVVLTCDDVVDLKSEQIEWLSYATILADVVGTRPYAIDE